MADAAWELQKAVHAALAGDAALTGLLGGAAIHDRVPPDAAFPFLAFAGASAADWSSQTGEGFEHQLVIDAWTRGGGRGEALALADAVRAALAGASLALAGHRLVNLVHEVTDIALDEDGETFHAALRYRAVTETGA